MSNPWDSVYHDLRQPFYEGDDKKQKNIKAAKKGKRWQDNDADGKWYEKGVDVKKEDTEQDQRAAIEKAKTDRIQDLKVAGKKKKECKEEGIADIIARLEKKRIRKGGDPDESPLPAMRKYHAAKKKKKETKSEEVVQEADSLAAQTARWEANRQRRMKKSGSYERPNWIPRDQDHEDRYGSSKGEKKKPQKKNANLQNEEGVINHIDGSKTEVIDIVPNPHARKRAHEDWRSDLEYFDEGKKKGCDECGSEEHTTSECDVKNEGKVPHPTEKPIKEGGVKNKVTINPVVNVESKVDEAIGTLTNADRVGNTPAWQNRNKLNKFGKPLYKFAPHLNIQASHEPEGEVIEAKVDAGKSPETKEKDRNVRKFGVSHNVAGHGKLRRSLHKMNRGDKKIKGDKSKWMEMEDVNVKKSSPLDHSLEEKESKGSGVSEGSINWTPKTTKKDKKDMSKKSGTAKNDYRLMAQSYDPEGEVISELDNAGGPAALGAVLTAGAGLAKVGFDAVNKVKNSLQKKVQQKNKLLNQETEYANIRKIIDEHHTKDANGKVIEHGDGTPSSVEENIIQTLINKAKENAAKRKKWREENPGGTISKQTHLNQIRSQGGDTSHWEEKSLLDQVAQITLEATRLKKEKGYDKGGTKKPKKKDAAFDLVKKSMIAKYGSGVLTGDSRQAKKVKGAKSTAGTGKYKKVADDRKQLKKDAKEMGYGSNVKGYIETKARYGSKSNMKKGKGLGT